MRERLGGEGLLGRPRSVAGVLGLLSASNISALTPSIAFPQFSQLSNLFPAPLFLSDDDFL